MKILSKVEGIQWLEREGFASIDQVTKKAKPLRHEYSLPVDTGAKTALGRALISGFEASEQECLFWITDFGIWPSSENPRLFEAYRRSLGENRHVSDAPCHLFEKKEMDKFEDLIHLVLYSYWGGVALSPKRDVALEISHDEWFGLYFAEKEAESRLLEVLSGLKLRKFQTGGKPRGSQT